MFSWMDLVELLKKDIVHRQDQELVVSYFDHKEKKFVHIDSDASLLAAFDMFWDIRRLAILVGVKDTWPRLAYLTANENASNVISTQQSQVEQQNQIEQTHSADSRSSSDTDSSTLNKGGKGKSKEPAVGKANKDDWGVDDEKANYRDLVSDDDVADCDYYPDSDEEAKDPLAVDDEKGCEHVVHITDIENPKIEEGVTFEDGTCFKRCIKQYAVLNEVELAVPYNECTMYRAYCKAKRCRWRIHASQLQDGRTWMIKKIPYKHTCASTGKVEQNCMATNHWFKDRVINFLRADPTIGPKALKDKVEEKYCIKISYYVAWDGRQMALDEVLGGWEDSFEHVFSWKREIETRSPGSIVEVDWELIGGKHRFRRMFVALKPCIDDFLNGCRAYLGIDSRRLDSTALTGRWKGQLASAIAVDGHNWMFPVAYGVFGSETTENWKWFMEMLNKAIGSPIGLVISTDAGKGIDGAVTKVFSNGVEHRECMRHLVKNFQKRYRREVFERNLWPAARAYRRSTYERHYKLMNEACPEAMKWLADNHKLLWARSMFSHISKCDYCTNNIAKTFNCWVRNEKSLPVIDLLDKIRQMIMERFCTRAYIAAKLIGKILPHVMKGLHDKSRNLKFSITKFTVDLEKKECSCRYWQMTGLPCVHAIAFIGTRRLELEDFVDKYYSVQKFKVAYAGYVCPLPDKTQWEPVDIGFKLLPPLLKRAAGRPRTRRIVGVEEGGSGTKRRQRCKRCGGLGHLQKTCNETVLDPDAPPPAPPKKRRRTKPKVIDLGVDTNALSDGKKKKQTRPRVGR
ncbi:hypothetical protein U9M48_020734 [Paspalum notatum var. saurae]|uniref:SWIM-type domain-containing protein n=1 Tax=Paspalum notatum var. saurae TaxID=547442 RepID=A0AAQ3TFE8_PASNO